MGEWLQRAGRLKSAGASAIDPAELSAVHAALYPQAPPVRTGCRKCVIDAWQAISRYLRLHTETDSSSLISPAMSANQNQARFISDDTQYFPFGLGVAVNNDNMTDKMARYILEQDADAAGLFKTLPAEEQEDSDDSDSDSDNTTVVVSDRMHRDELEAIYLDAAPDGDAKAFANKADLITAIEALSNALKPAK
ncbi:hypothetical protein D0N36_06950 [Hymenobacter lapidiphilus]|nr:hypothetical protein D0N36_06950 [Hymenobacter sp. CCM 8763]